MGLPPSCRARAGSCSSEAGTHTATGLLASCTDQQPVGFTRVKRQLLKAVCARQASSGKGGLGYLSQRCHPKLPRPLQVQPTLQASLSPLGLRSVSDLPSSSVGQNPGAPGTHWNPLPHQAPWGRSATYCRKWLVAAVLEEASATSGTECESPSHQSLGAHLPRTGRERMSPRGASEDCTAAQSTRSSSLPLSSPMTHPCPVPGAQQRPYMPHRGQHWCHRTSPTSATASHKPSQDRPGE